MQNVVKKHKDKVRTAVTYVSVSSDFAGQRIDNFLMTRLKGVPRTHIYRLLRKGEVRVNKKRVAASYRLNVGDSLRLPPLFLAEKGKVTPPSADTLAYLSERILYEDERLLILNKPANMSVHAGSTVRMGVIEALKHQYPHSPQLELAHRLDAETSGCLIIAKKRSTLRELHTLFREGQVVKVYWALTQGHWQDDELTADFALHKHYRHAGKHMVEVSASGKASLTHFRPLAVFAEASLTEAILSTGRTHQIRVHAAHLGHPIAGDERYGSLEFNKLARQRGLKRMFLHASRVEFTLPSQGQRIRVIAPLDEALETVINTFEQDKHKHRS